MQTLVHAASLRPRVEVASRTDPGRDPDKQVNEDSLAYRPTPMGHLLVVCDGMGGHHSGEEASSTALKTIIELLEAAPLDAPVRAAVDHAVRMANDRVHALATPDAAARPGSTIVLALLQSSGAIIAHVGDSRCYLIRQNSAIALTKDHSVVQQMVDNGLITPEQAIGHPDANRILRALGVAPGVDVDVRQDAVPFAAGDSFLLCSDGLTDLVMGPEIARVVAESPTPEVAAQRLVDLANERGGHDNISVLIARTLDDCTMQAQPTVVNTRPDTMPDHRPFVPMTPPHGAPQHVPHGGPHVQQPPSHPHGFATQGMMHPPPGVGAPPPPISSGRFPDDRSQPSLPPSRPRTNPGIERGILIAGAVLVVLFLAVLAAVTGVLLARPKSKTPVFVDASPTALPSVPNVVLPPPDTAPLPDLVPADSAPPLPAHKPSPSAAPHQRKPSSL